LPAERVGKLLQRRYPNFRKQINLEEEGLIMQQNSVLVATFLLGSALFVPAGWAADGPSDSHSGGAPSAVLEVDGVKISFAEVEKKLPGNVFQARNAFYQAERAAIDQFVGEYLLDRQAEKEGVTVTELLNRHVNSVIAKDPSEETLRVFYETIDTKDPYEVIRDRIIEHLRDARLAKAKAAYVESLRSQADINILLDPPRVIVPVDDAPLTGAANAPVTIIEYADYECPYCQQVNTALQKLLADYKGKLALVFKDSPLPIHAHSQKAAEAAHCAGAQGKYWEYHDLLFSSKQLDDSQLKEHARALKLDEKAFDSCLDSGAQAPTVKKFLTEAQSLQIKGTPSFVINGRFVAGGFTYEQLRGLVDEELRATTASTHVSGEKEK